MPPCRMRSAVASTGGEGRTAGQASIQQWRRPSTRRSSKHARKQARAHAPPPLPLPTWPVDQLVLGCIHLYAADREAEVYQQPPRQLEPRRLDVVCGHSNQVCRVQGRAGGKEGQEALSWGRRRWEPATSARSCLCCESATAVCQAQSHLQPPGPRRACLVLQAAAAERRLQASDGPAALLVQLDACR